MKNKLLIGSIFLLAAILRSIPLIRFGLVLDEFDPYFNYKVTRYMCENGLKAFVSWHDDTVWYPRGRDILDTTYPGMMFYAYLIHKCVSIFFRTAVYDICVIFPILGGLFTLYSIYSLTKFISNKQCAIIALFLSSLIPGLSQRTMSGFFDYECISIALINLCFLYYLKYLKSGKTQDMCIFIFTYFNLGMCWGGYVFVMNFIALHSISCMITNKYQKLLSTYFPNLVCKQYDPKIFPILYLVGNGLLYIVPVIGKKCFMSQEQIVPLFALLLHMLTFKKLRIPTLFAIPIVLYTSNAAFKTGKLLNLFIKQKGSALVESISEHLPRGFVRFYLDCNILCFIMPLSFTALFDLEHFNSTFMLIYATICVFISAKIVRCVLLAAPCFCICSSMYINKVYASVKNNPFQKRLFLSLSAIVSIFYTIHSSKVAYHTYSVPQLLLYTADGRVITDFHDTYRFLSRFDGVILNWWDYGYQINAYSKIKTLNDNNTNDWDRIREVAQIFMSSEEDAYKQCLKNNIDCVFITSGVDNGYSQDMIAKSGWINKIASENCNFTNAGKESMLYKLVYFGNSSLYDHVRKGTYEPVQLTYFTLAYRSEHNIVKIYSVKK